MGARDQNANLLRGISLFASLPDAELERIAQCCRWLDCAAGRQIIDHLDRTSDCFLIASGAVRVVVHSAAGKEITFRDIGAGEIVGELSAIDGKPRSASVVALTPARIARLTSADLWAISERNPSVAGALIRRLAELVRNTTERVVAITTLPVGPRVHVEVLRLALAAGVTSNRAVILRPPTHHEIASRVAARREAVTRELSRLADAGVIERHGRDLIVCDVAGLRRSVDAFVGVAPDSEI